MTFSYNLINSRKQFIDPNGNPLAGGLVHYYTPGTTTPVTTFSDQTGLVVNANPVVLDSAGSASVYGAVGSVYREYITDALGNLISDGVTVTPLASTFYPFATISTLRANAVVYATATVAYVSGYYAVSDDGEGLFVRAIADSSSADNGGTIIVDAAGQRWYRQTQGEAYSVKWFGCKGDGSTDDTTNAQKCITFAEAIGGMIYFPAGKYVISGAGLKIDKSAMSLLTDITRVSVKGAGVGNTVLSYTGTGACFSYLGSTLGSGAGASGFFTMSDMQIIGSSTSNGSVGLSVTLAAYWSLRDVYVLQFQFGINLIDTLSWLAERCTVLYCDQGIFGSIGSFSSPNAITMIGCTVGQNNTYGIQLQGVEAFTYNGGSIESNGLTAFGNAGYGVQLYQPGLNGAVAGNFIGVHFENNSDIADIYVNTSPTTAQVSVLNAIGCTFARTSATKYVNNNIQVNSNTGNGPIKVTVIGCGFRGFNGYSPSSLRPYILIQPGGGQTALTELGNVFADAVEKPTAGAYLGQTVSQRAMASAWVNFGWSGSAIAISDSLNVVSVTRTSAGIYVVNFAGAMQNAAYITSVTTLSAGFQWVSAVGVNSVTIHTTDTSSVVDDPANVYVCCIGGNTF